MNILILGGTSFVGPVIARKLTERGDSVTLFTRQKKNSLRTLHFEQLQGDVRDSAKLVQISKQKAWDVVIHQLAYNATDAENVVQAFDADRLILTSSIAVYRFARNNTQPFKESQVDHDFRPKEEDTTDVHWQYARGKLEAENALVKQTKISYTVLRQSFVFGPHDTTERSLWYAERLMNKKPIILPEKAHSIRLLFAEDAANAFCLALNERARNQIFNVAQAESITLKEYVESLAKNMDAEPRFGKGSPSPELSGPLFYERDWNMDISKIRDLGFTPTPFPEAIAETARWFRLNR